MEIKTVILRLLQFIFLTILFLVIYAGSSMPLAPFLPPLSAAEPGPVPSPFDILLVSAVQVLVVMVVLLASRWRGWKLALAAGFAYYGVTTVMGQIEAWYFLSDLTLPAGLVPRMFVTGLATGFVFVPLAVLVLWKVRQTAEPGGEDTVMPA